jgi:hypothetical protein
MCQARALSSENRAAPATIFSMDVSGKIAEPTTTSGKRHGVPPGGNRPRRAPAAQSRKSVASEIVEPVWPLM